MMVNVSLRGICGIYIFWIKDKLKCPVLKKVYRKE